MSKWILQPGRTDEKGRGGVGSFTQTFHADANDGESEAISQGYVLGFVVAVDGKDWELDRRSVRRLGPVDEVTLRFESPNGTTGRNRYQDGKLREDGEEQWYLRGSLGQPLPKARAVKFDGDYFDISDSDPAANDPIEQPMLELVWDKWFDKDSGLSKKVNTLPTTQEAALVMADTYMPNGSGTYEGLGKPRLMHTLAAEGSGAKLLCVSIDISEDGDLVKRTAVFLHNPAGWDADAYGGP